MTQTPIAPFCTRLSVGFAALAATSQEVLHQLTHKAWENLSHEIC